MAIAFVQGGSASGRAATVTVTFGATATAGNLLVGCASRRGISVLPTGYTNVDAFVGNQNYSTRICAKRSDGTETDLGMGNGTSRQTGVTFLEFSGVATNLDPATNTFVDGTTQTDLSAGLQNDVLLSDHTTTAADMVLVAMALLEDDDFATFAWSNSFTQAGSVEQIGGIGDDILHTVAYRIVSATGAYGTEFTTASGGDEAAQGLITAAKIAALMPSGLALLGVGV